MREGQKEGKEGEKCPKPLPADLGLKTKLQNTCVEDSLQKKLTEAFLRVNGTCEYN